MPYRIRLMYRFAVRSAERPVALVRLRHVDAVVVLLEVLVADRVAAAVLAAAQQPAEHPRRIGRVHHAGVGVLAVPVGDVVPRDRLPVRVAVGEAGPSFDPREQPLGAGPVPVDAIARRVRRAHRADGFPVGAGVAGGERSDEVLRVGEQEDVGVVVPRQALVGPAGDRGQREATSQSRTRRSRSRSRSSTTTADRSPTGPGWWRSGPTSTPYRWPGWRRTSRRSRGSRHRTSAATASAPRSLAALARRPSRFPCGPVPVEGSPIGRAPVDAGSDLGPSNAGNVIGTLPSLVTGARRGCARTRRSRRWRRSGWRQGGCRAWSARASCGRR